ncbi:MAG: RNA 3'-terminal phosphate cyclase [Candidatus Aenigmarchaeota archaeon]|nr:RNA 3'-terminal phosphate cyclase [Candidatus Aenigmarchaeota archaeon]
MKTIDGSLLEGGGAILRLAVGFSVLKQQPIRVTNIRKNRPKPGLKHQHLVGLQAVSKLCDGKIIGDKLGSEEIEFYPNDFKKNNISVRIDTAGSAGLVLQTLQLACLFSGQNIDVKILGGADAGKFAPPVLYLQNVTLKLLQKMGYTVEIKINKHGFYPVGGGEFEIKIPPCNELKPIVLKEQGSIKTIRGISVASRQLEKAGVAERQAASAKKALSDAGDVNIETNYVESACPGSFIVLWLETDSGAILGSDCIGERGLPAHQVGERAAKDLLKAWESGATVDIHAADQLIPFMALAGSESTIKAPGLSRHAETNIWLSEQFTSSRFCIKKNNKNVEISCIPK